MIYSWTVSGDPKNAGMHVHVAAFPYLDVTKISIWQSCLNFTVYPVHMQSYTLPSHPMASIYKVLKSLDVMHSYKVLTPTKNAT